MSVMWIAKFQYKHDCMLGNRCKKFKVSLQSVGFSVFREGGRIVNSSLHQMSGDVESMDRFIKDLKNDPDVITLERKGDTFLLIEKAEEKAAAFFTPKIIFVKPVLIGKDGYETWEISSWKKEEVAQFVNHTKRTIKDFKLLRMSQEKIDNVFFPRLMPKLTDKQKRSIELAIEEGYYETPRRTNLRQLAKIMKVSLATYDQHLRVAEEKLIPNILSYSA